MHVYPYTYELNGSTGGADVAAEDKKDAKEKVKKIFYTYDADGKVVSKAPKELKITIGDPIESEVQNG